MADVPNMTRKNEEIGGHSESLPVPCGYYFQCSYGLRSGVRCQCQLDLGLIESTYGRIKKHCKAIKCTSSFLLFDM